MKKPTVVLLHIVYWFIYIFFTFSSLLIMNAYSIERAGVGLLLYFLLSLLYFYVFYLFLVPRYLASRKIRHFLGSAIGVSMFAFPIILLVQLLTVPASGLTDIVIEDRQMVLVLIQWTLLFLFCTFLALINGMMGTLMKGFITWYNEIRVKEVLSKKNLQTELALLKAQINPHFLFNTLNNIDVLIEKNAQTASVFLKKLSDIMRFILYDTQEERIPLTLELEYIGKYIDLQNIRTANEEFVTYEVRGEAHKLSVPPMLFIPFIENAFKHSTNKKIKEAITIRIEAAMDNKMIFSCKNVVNAEKPLPTRNSGLGIELIRQRLQLLYPDKHTLSIHQTTETFEVDLTINLNVD